MNNPNSFSLEGGNVLFFNIFIKNNLIYLITPIHKTNIAYNTIRIEYNNKELKLKEVIEKKEYEATQILIYDFPFDNKQKYDISVTYNEIVKHYELENSKMTKNKKLTLTTLFKTDYKLNEIFYDYYKKQGVEHFYMYYNGKINNEIKNYYNKSDITLIEWDFKYWNTNSAHSKHYAQLGQIHDAIYRFGKNNTEYMIFCDLDEYIYNEKSKLIDLIKNTSVDTFGCINIFSSTLDGSLPNQFPTEFKIGEEWGYKKRSKCIHKMDSIIYINIHYGQKYNKKINLNTDCKMYHFHTWGGEHIRSYPTDKGIIKIEEI